MSELILSYKELFFYLLIPIIIHYYLFYLFCFLKRIYWLFNFNEKRSWEEFKDKDKEKGISLSFKSKIEKNLKEFNEHKTDFNRFKPVLTDLYDKEEEKKRKEKEKKEKKIERLLKEENICSFEDDFYYAEFDRNLNEVSYGYNYADLYDKPYVYKVYKMNPIKEPGKRHFFMEINRDEMISDWFKNKKKSKKSKK